MIFKHSTPSFPVKISANFQSPVTNSYPCQKPEDNSVLEMQYYLGKHTLGTQLSVRIPDELKFAALLTVSVSETNIYEVPGSREPLGILSGCISSTL